MSLATTEEAAGVSQFIRRVHADATDAGDVGIVVCRGSPEKIRLSIDAVAVTLSAGDTACATARRGTGVLGAAASGVPATGGVEGTEAFAVAVACADMNPPDEVASCDRTAGEDAFGVNCIRRTGDAGGTEDAWGTVAPSGD